MWACKRERDTKRYPNSNRSAVPSKWNIFTHISPTRTYTHIYINRHWIHNTHTHRHTLTVLSGSQCCSIIEQPWCNWQHAFWHVMSIHRQRRCRKTSQTPLAASCLLFLHQDRRLSALLPPTFHFSLFHFFLPFLSCMHLCPSCPPLPVSSLSSPSISPVYARSLCIISTTSLPPSSLSLVQCFTEAGSPNPLWHPYLNLLCYCSFHPTAPTRSPL